MVARRSAGLLPSGPASVEGGVAEVQEIRINRVELKLADTDDPLASKVSWQPLVGGGSSFRTHRLRKADGRLTVRRTLGGVVFACVFMVPGTLAVLAALPAALLADEKGWLIGGFLLLWGAGFGGAGWLLLLGGKPLTFDARAGVYYRGKAYVHGEGRATDQQGSLNNIHALQLVSEHITGSGRNRSSFVSHELNLVLDDGERVNVMDHGGDIETCARSLAELLDVPLWKASL